MGKQHLRGKQASKKSYEGIQSKISKEQNKEQDSNRFLEKSEPNLECIICYSSIVDQGIIESCQHKFCFKCIKIWAKQNLSCPQCRADFTRINRIWKKGSAEKQQIYTFDKPKETDVNIGMFAQGDNYEIISSLEQLVLLLLFLENQQD